MRQLVTLCLFVAPFFVLTSFATAADIGNGQRLAGEICADCHDVSAGGVMQEMPPSFAAIAQFRAPEDIRARIAFPPAHTSMPKFGMIWGKNNLDDLVAYIVSLERE